ncbi:CapA family protein [Stutzerimonas nitrititolerans]|uniref:CapA family protein n=1 Tax=Stutzerimonas nitrititolerans TaxID=2482751 RepID=UPI002897325D|nr:CapA family protein [Stutzerimonas nitrititolerans]
MTQNKNVNILFSGDFAPCRGYESVVLDCGTRVHGDALPIIENADLSFVNLECPLTTHGKAINKSGPALKASPACVKALKPFSVVGLANNHILDYGRKGLEDTLLACRSAGLPTVGAGLDLKEAQQPFIQDIKGVKIAIIALAEYEFNQSEDGGAGSAPIDPIDNYQQIMQAKTQADIVIVTLHGGNEYFPYPRPGLRKLCKHYIDLGAEAVICHHPHVPGAYEYHQGKPILYSLGNFIFDNAKPPKDWDLGYMARIDIDRESKNFCKLELIPYRQSIELKGIKLLADSEKAFFLESIENRRKTMEDNDAWLREWNSLVVKQTESYILRQYFPLISRGLGFLSKYTPLARIFYGEDNNVHKLNMLRCQSHYELLVEIIKSKSKMRDE